MSQNYEHLTSNVEIVLNINLKNELSKANFADQAADAVHQNELSTEDLEHVSGGMMDGGACASHGGGTSGGGASCGCKC
jgi:hypothetical protein